MAISFADKSLDTMRTLITVVDRELASGSPSPALLAAWTELVGTLALGPAPELRECPNCADVGMRAATRCGRCWAALPVLDAPTAPSAS